MAKPQPSVLKRQREQKQREKRLLKAEKKAQRQYNRQQDAQDPAASMAPRPERFNFDPPSAANLADPAR